MASAQGAIAGLPTFMADDFHSLSGKTANEGRWAVWKREITLWGHERTIDGRTVDVGKGTAAWGFVEWCDSREEAERRAAELNAA